MKYIIGIFLIGIIAIITSPIMLMTWSLKGFDSIMDGISEMLGLDK
jgi:uncharacterized membrane protein